MKPLAIWVVIVAIVFGGYAVVASLLRETEQVVVVVDASQPMQLLNNRIIVELDRIDDRSDTEFALAYVRRNTATLIHSWQPELRWSNEPLFAPCSFEGIDSFAETTDADERILITTPQSCDTSALTDWTIIELGS